MPARARRLSEADKALWVSYTRQIAPLPGKRPVEPAAPLDAAPTVAPPVRALPPAPARRANAPAIEVGAHPGGMDTGTWHRFRSGKLRAVRKLDLHGMTAQRAFHALTGFLRLAHADGVRCVEIVTGRGSGENGGVIRRELPLWLNLPDIRPMILGAAHPHAANPGSVRLILRRIR